MLKVSRLVDAQSNGNNSKVRLNMRHDLKKMTIQQLKRGYENGD